MGGYQVMLLAADTLHAIANQAKSCLCQLEGELNIINFAAHPSWWGPSLARTTGFLPESKRVSGCRTQGMGESASHFFMTSQRLWLYIGKILMTKSWKNRKCALSSPASCRQKPEPAALLPLRLLHSLGACLGACMGACLSASQGACLAATQSGCFHIAWVLVCLLAWVLVWGSFIVCLSVLPRSDKVSWLDGFQDTVRQK